MTIGEVQHHAHQLGMSFLMLAREGGQWTVSGHIARTNWAAMGEGTTIEEAVRSMFREAGSPLPETEPTTSILARARLHTAVAQLNRSTHDLTRLGIELSALTGALGARE